MLLFRIKKEDLQKFSAGGIVPGKIGGVERRLTYDGVWVDYDSEEGRQHRRVIIVCGGGDYSQCVYLSQASSAVTRAVNNGGGQ